MSGGAALTAVGMTTALGVGAAPSAAAVRAGVAAFDASPVHDRRVQPIGMAVLPDEALPPLAPGLDAVSPGLTARQARMLRLAAPALAEALAGAGAIEPVPLLLGVPETLAGRPETVDERFLELLAQQAGIGLDFERSAVFPQGRASGLMALAAAVALVESGTVAAAVAGGVDSYLDLHLLGTLDLEDRVLGPANGDGFVPGEGAGFVVVRAPNAEGVLAEIVACAEGREPGHRYSDEPYRGDGLAQTLQTLFAAASDAPPAATVYAGLNGENLGAKEWGVSYLRSADRFVEGFRIEHPVDCFGDPGAALGPILVGLAALGLASGRVSGPCLAWCSSDREQRAAVLLQSPSPSRGAT